jgi:hypothetical protein
MRKSKYDLAIIQIENAIKRQIDIILEMRNYSDYTIKSLYGDKSSFEYWLNFEEGVLKGYRNIQAFTQLNLK